MPYQQLKTPNLGITYTGGWCLKAVEDAFDTPHVFSTAMDDWNAGENGKGNHDGEQPPAGVYVPVYFALGDEPAGHIAIAMPDGRVASSTQTGVHNGLYIHPNLNDLIRIYAQYHKSCTYLGWSEGTGNTPVVQRIADQGGGTDVTPEQDFQNCFITQATRWPNQDEVNAWQASGLQPYEWVQKNAPNPAANPNTVSDYLASAKAAAEKTWIWVLAEAFQGVAFGSYPDAAADGHVNAILSGASRATIARGFATDGGWLSKDDANGLRSQLTTLQTQDQAQIADLTRQNKNLTSQALIAQDTIKHLSDQLEAAQQAQPASEAPAADQAPDAPASTPTAPHIVVPGPVATKPSIQPDNKPFWKKILSLFINF